MGASNCTWLVRWHHESAKQENHLCISLFISLYICMNVYLYLNKHLYTMCWLSKHTHSYNDIYGIHLKHRINLHPIKVSLNCLIVSHVVGGRLLAQRLSFYFLASNSFSFWLLPLRLLALFAVVVAVVMPTSVLSSFEHLQCLAPFICIYSSLFLLDLLYLSALLEQSNELVSENNFFFFANIYNLFILTADSSKMITFSFRFCCRK